MKRICPVCGEPAMVKTGNYGPAPRYCSNACRQLAYRRRKGRPRKQRPRNDGTIAP